MNDNSQNQEILENVHADQNQGLPVMNQGLQQQMGEAVPTNTSILPPIHSVQQLDPNMTYQLPENSNIIQNPEQIPNIQISDNQALPMGIQQHQIDPSIQMNDVQQPAPPQIVASENQIQEQVPTVYEEQPISMTAEEAEDDDPDMPHYLNANVYQIAMLNKMLPKGFKFDILDVVKRQTEVHMKKTAGLVNYMNKKPEIQNELKQKKLIQKYNQKRLREQQKLEEQQAKIMSEQRKMQAESGSSMIFNSKTGGNNKHQKHNEKDISSGYQKKDGIQRGNIGGQGQGINHQMQGDMNGKSKKSNNKRSDDDAGNMNPEHTLGNNKKNKGPCAKDYFNTDLNNGILQSEYSETKAKASFKGTYEQYSRVIESMVMHKVLLEQQEVPLFLKNPDPESTKNYKSIMNDFGTSGFLNFNIILQRLKNKKYGPGKQNVKHDLLCADVRKIFQICEKYYNYDPVSIRVSRYLESFFESEIKKIGLGNTIKIDANNQAQKGANDKGKGSGVRQSFNNEVQSDCDRFENNSSFSYKRIKKDKKKDKKKSKKKNKNRRHDRDSDDGKDQTSIGNVNAVDLNEEIEKGEAYGSNSGNLVQKQRLYNNITEYLTISQKKGIIPIVQEQLSKEDPVSYQAMIKSNQKFEFDLFSLPDTTCQRLEQYVNECIQTNQQGASFQPPVNLPENDILPQSIPNQIIPPQIPEQQEIQNFNQENHQEIQYMQQENQPNTEVVPPENVQMNTFPAHVGFYNLEDVNQPYLGDKHSLIEKIGRLDNNQLKGIVPIVQQYQMNDQQQNQDDSKLEFDLYDLPDQKLKELHNYVEQCINDDNVPLNQDNALNQGDMDQMKQYMENQQMVDSNGMLQGQLDIQNQMQQQMFNNPQQQSNFYMNQQQQFPNENGQENNQSLGQDQQQMMMQNQPPATNQPAEIGSDMQFNQVNSVSQTHQATKQAENSEMNDNLSEMDQRIKLVQSIKNLSMDELTQLGMVMSSQEYRNIDRDANDGQQNQLEEQNRNLIELNVNELSVAKIQYLQRYVDKQHADKLKSQQSHPLEEGITTEVYNEEKEKVDRQTEQDDQQFQQISQWCQQQIDEQMEQYNQNQIVLSELAQLQNNAPNNELSQENQTKLYNAMQLEQTIQMNLQQIQQYHIDQQQQYQQKKQTVQVEAQEREQKHQAFLSGKAFTNDKQNSNENNGTNQLQQSDMNMQSNLQNDNQPQSFNMNQNVGSGTQDNKGMAVDGSNQQNDVKASKHDSQNNISYIDQAQVDQSKSGDVKNQGAEQSVGLNHQQDPNSMSVETLQVRQKQIVEEYNQVTFQMQRNQTGVEQIVQMSSQLQQMYQQHEQMAKEAKEKGTPINQTQTDQMNQVSEQINMHQQQIMAIMQNQTELQNKISELKVENDQINMALQMKMGGPEASNAEHKLQTKVQDENMPENQQVAVEMTQEQMNNYYMQLQYQQQMNNQHATGQEGEQQQITNPEMILEQKQQDSEQQAQNNHLMTPYNTQMDFEKAREANN